MLCGVKDAWIIIHNSQLANAELHFIIGLNRTTFHNS